MSPHPDVTPYSFNWAPTTSRPTVCPRCLGPAEWLTDRDTADGVCYAIRCPRCTPDTGQAPNPVVSALRRAMPGLHGIRHCGQPGCQTCMSI